MKTNKLEVLNIQDLMFAKVFGMSQEEIEEMDLFQQKRKMQNMFDRMMIEWSQGNKPELTLEDAQELDKKYQNIVAQLECEHNHDYMGDSLVRFEAIPKDDYSIGFYLGLPSVVDWASKMLD